jgi:uncharacterized protein YuzE
MKIRYDPEADAMYIKVGSKPIDRTKKIDENTIMDFDSSVNLIGIELLFVKERNPSLLKELKFENLISA